VTRIDFYFNAENKHDTVRRLCGKAMAAHARVMVWTQDAPATKALSRHLWCIPSTGFLPHCPTHDALAAVTPIILDERAETFPHDDVLINLRAEVPPFFSRFQRLIEVVGADEDDKAAGRARFKFYRDRGYPLGSHDLAAGGD